MDAVLLEEDFGVAEPEHLEMMMDALIDTVEQQVAGTECLSLTRAQSYAVSVLQSSGMVSRIAMVTGNEGFFSSIGSGVKKLWEYIEKMVKGIWNWFFGKDDKGASIVEETEARIEACNNSLKAWAANDAKLREHIGQQMITTMAQLDTFMLGDDSSAKGEAKQLKEELEAVKGQDETKQVEVTKKVLEKVVKLNRRTQRAIRETCEQALEQYKKYYTIAEEDKSEHFKGTIFEDNYHRYKQWVAEGKQKPLDAFIMIPTSIDSLSHALRAQESLLKAVKSLDGEKRHISAHFKTEVTVRIKSLQEKIEQSKHDSVREKWSKDLTACKIFLGMTTDAIKQIEEACRTIKRINTMIMRLFGIPEPKAKGRK